MQSQIGELDSRVKNAGAVGVYRGQPAVAAGDFRHLGDQVMLRVGASTTGSEWPANAGITYSWQAVGHTDKQAS